METVVSISFVVSYFSICACYLFVIIESSYTLRKCELQLYCLLTAFFDFSLRWAYPRFCSMKRLGVFLLLLDGMLVHRRSFPCSLLGFPNNLSVPINTPGWREVLWELSGLPKNTTQCPRPGQEPGPLAPGTTALTMKATAPPNCYINFYLKNLFIK